MKKWTVPVVIAAVCLLPVLALSQGVISRNVIPGNSVVNGPLTVKGAVSSVDMGLTGSLYLSNSGGSILVTPAGGWIGIGAGGSCVGDCIQFKFGATEVAGIDSRGGIRLGVAGTAAPTCDASVRGMIHYTPGGAGVKDILQACAKDAANAYAWRAIY